MSENYEEKADLRLCILISQTANLTPAVSAGVVNFSMTSLPKQQFFDCVLPNACT